ncbi:MAG: LamG domain-containing protein [Planctomycetota bacterium]
MRTALRLAAAVTFLWSAAIAHAELKLRADDTLGRQPQWRTSSRLLELGESIEFDFYRPGGAGAVEVNDLALFPRYLERAEPTRDFLAGNDLSWLDGLPSEKISLAFVADRASVTYTPEKPGSYLARWCAGGDVFYRYFSVIEEDWIVLRFSTFGGLESEPTLHATGIPLDYRLPIQRFHPNDPLFQKLLGYHRHHGDTIIPLFPDTPGMSQGERVALYGEGLARARDLLPDSSDARSARVEMHHDLDSGYTETLASLGVNDHCGLNEANAKPWLGMPEFPYFSSPIDCRKVNQGESGSVVAHQWDFCGGWHFLGPVSWHFKAAEGNWALTEKCLHHGLDEFKNLAELSGHPAFAMPLYDGLVGPGYPNPVFQYRFAEPRPFRGLVDQVFLAERALSSEEIVHVMKDGAENAIDALAVWNLDGGEGTQVSDTSGNGFHGRLVNDPQRVPGKLGLALSFDGEKDYVVTDAPVTVDTVDFTLGCWVKPGKTQKRWANLLSSHDNGIGGDYRGISIEQDGDHPNRFYLIAGNGTEWIGASVTTQLKADVWQHFAVVRRGSRLIHYLNGQVSAEGEIPNSPFKPATGPFRIANWARGDGENDAMFRFVDRYQRFMAFEAPKEHKVVYARSIDVADYYRRHFRVTPRTVFVSRTDHVMYDMWWLCHWASEGFLVPRERIPWLTRISSIMDRRRTRPYSKDPLSYEYILVEDQRRSIRFERESPNPIWWFDYADQTRGPEGSAIAHTETPDVTVLRSPWTRDDRTATVTLSMQTAAEFPDYAIALWSLPEDFDPGAAIETTAKEHLLARNTDGEHHLILFFDLKPNVEIKVEIGRRQD